jgi:hypothetical protein
MPIVLKSESLNPLEFLGPVQGCKGFALPFYFSSLLHKSFILFAGVLSTNFNVCLLYTNICTNKLVYNKHLLFNMHGINIKVINAQQTKSCNIYTIFNAFNNPSILLFTL